MTQHFYELEAVSNGFWTITYKGRDVLNLTLPEDTTPEETKHAQTALGLIIETLGELR